MATRFDVAIIGGGVVGLATAVALIRRQGRSVVVLEAEDRLAAHQTGHNSGVIHSGLYYKTGSLKAELCTTGREALFAFCEAEGVPHRRCGKLVVATRAEELGTLSLLEERGRANGLRGLRRLGPAELREREPNATGLSGLWVEETGVVNFGQVAAAYANVVRQGGGEIRTGARVTAVLRDAGGVTLETTAGAFAARFLVGCAGLHADRVALMCGVAPGVRIVPFRGEYYHLVPERAALVNGLIYPVPDPALPFLGVHFTRGIEGQVEAGPNAVLALKREGYTPWAVSPRDVVDTIAYPGFWRMAARFWRTGLAEVGRSLSKARFVRSLQALVPSIKPEDLARGGSGVRAQAVDRHGRLLDDFHIVPGDRMLHVLNAPSPAATASLSIGGRLAAMIVERTAA